MVNTINKANKNQLSHKKKLELAADELFDRYINYFNKEGTQKSINPIIGGNYTRKDAKEIHQIYEKNLTQHQDAKDIVSRRQFPVLDHSGIVDFPKARFGTFFAEIWDTIKSIVNGIFSGKLALSVRWSNKDINFWINQDKYFKNINIYFNFAQQYERAGNGLEHNLEQFKQELRTKFSWDKDNIDIQESDIVNLVAAQVQIIESNGNKIITYCDAYGTATAKTLPVLQKLFPDLAVVGIQGARRDLKSNRRGHGLYDHAEVVLTLPGDRNIYLIDPKAKNTIKPEFNPEQERRVKVIGLGLQNRLGSAACVTFSSAVAHILIQDLLALPNKKKYNGKHLQDLLSELNRYDLLRYLEGF